MKRKVLRINRKGARKAGFFPVASPIGPPPKSDHLASPQARANAHTHPARRTRNVASTRSWRSARKQYSTLSFASISLFVPI
ncbi:unnamed protein product [Caenorhabditis auriculariae]|uniref:Uncharacterized protein n=1 Tax=Caenorhabditis auriculariae TaxID=2777116 RepID=A0A8S1GSX3_9PELO|nr:unnamed protein product [Caenorhabditis auriculariae]